MAWVLDVFARMTGVDPTRWIGVPVAEAADGLPDAVEDVWFISDSLLRFRAASRKQGEMRFYQAEDGALAEIGTIDLGNDGPLFGDAAPHNPFLPILIVVAEADGSVASVGVLPFPSLCRGGAHFGELRVLAERPSYMTGLREVSRSLANEFLGWPEAAGFSIGALKVDAREATGGERIFSTAFKHWLGALFALDLTLADGAANSKVLEHIALRAVSAPPSRNTSDALCLTLPADALPTIGALVSRRLSIPDGASALVGSYVMADADTGVPRCSVSMPPLSGFLAALQPANAPIPFPLLTKGGEPAASGASRKGGVLAIRFTAAAASHEASLLFPSAPAAPVLETALTESEKSRARIAVLAGGEASPFLASLARQTVVARCEVVALSGSGSPSARINAAAEQTQASHILLAEDSIVLHDPRTLETLLLLTQDGAVASASCVIVRETRFEKGSALTLRSGGLHPAAVSLTGQPSLVFKEIDVLAAFPRATYPVVGNTFRLTLIRADVWKRLGGLDARNFPDAGHDVDFALRAIKAGHVHLCTSAVTASDIADTPTREHCDVLSLAFLPDYRWQDVFASSAIVKDLR